ncbi:MAG: response regulator [Planctomycetes bacterium]|nr:response regulator [Planctomycetota bacterium]
MAHLMIVDDDEDFATAVATALTSAGHEVDICLEAKGAIQKMAEARPDLLILDVVFPDNSAAGFELARAIRQNTDELGSTPILMLTAVNEKFPLGFGARDIDDNWLPISAFLEKPVDLVTLCNRVAALLKGEEA